MMMIPFNTRDPVTGQRRKVVGQTPCEARPPPATVSSGPGATDSRSLISNP